MPVTLPKFTNYSIFPTGGAIMLFFTTAKTGTVTLTRTSQTTNIPVTLYSGPPLRTDGCPAIYVDVGDDDTNSGQNPGVILSKFLNQSQTYVYTLTDTNGSTATDALQPAADPLVYVPDITPTFMKLLQVALQSNAPPSGISRAYVSFAPPEATFQQLPYIAIFPSKLNQADQPIGADAEVINEDNTWTIYEQAFIEITVVLFVNTPTELLYYRDRALALMKFIRAEYFAPIGADSSHTYSSETTMEVRPAVKAPSLFRCDIKFQFKAENNCTIQRNYGTIEHIDLRANDETTGGLDAEALVP